MALTATIHNFTIDLSNVDRGVYETFELKIARQPSETASYMLMRVFAYCLEYEEGIVLTEGVASGDEPAVLVRDLTGRVTAWIEVGMPDADRLHRGMKLAGRAAIYTHRELRQVLANLEGKKIHRSEEIVLYSFEPRLVEEIAESLDRRTALTMSVTEGEMYLSVNGRHYQTTIGEMRLP